MGRKNYGIDEHKHAWEVWYETRNRSEIQRQVGCDYTTAKRWQDEDFNCPDGCPYHGYDKLIAKRDAALSKRYELIQQGETNPAKLSMAMQEVVGDAPLDINRHPIRGPVMETIVTDLERLGHWMYIYRKVFYDFTGIPLTFDPTTNEAEITPAQEKAREFYRKGLKVTNAEAAARILKMCEEQMDKLQGAKRGADEQKKSEKPMLDIKDLMQLHEQFKENPKEKLKSVITAAKISARSVSPDES